MAGSNVATLHGDVDEYLFDETIEDVDFEDEKEEPITVDEAVADLSLQVELAVDFITSDMMPNWENAEAYMNGETDLPLVSGRSQVSSTDVRDAVRSLKPSMMRVFTQADAVVEYSPMTIRDGALAQQQTAYVNQLFWGSDGYTVLRNVIHDAMVNKVGISKAWWYEKTSAEYLSLTGLSQAHIDYITGMEGVYVLEVEQQEADELHSESAEGAVPVFDVEVAVLKEKGQIDAKYVPLNEFFVDDAATSPSDARVIGQRQNLPISECREMGLEYDDWDEIDGLDLEISENTEFSEQKRGYVEDTGEETNKDPAMRKVLITEVYARYDLEGIGIAQLYRFWLGGTGYTYLDHDRVSEVPYSCWQIDPEPGVFFGRSIYDILKEDQDTSTSLLRATCDNAHLSNNKRLGVHETMVNMDDVLNNNLGYPIRVKAPGMIQEIGVSSSVGTMLPLLQYLRQQTENKVGVTAAAMGLDPDALQSTDKEAVQNTIQLSQGQVELMCRNLAETGGRPMFQTLLALSMRHHDRDQVLTSGESLVPVDLTLFDPAMSMKVKVGIGNASWEMKLAGLNQVAASQEKIVAAYGMDNPVVTPQHMHNTVSDITAMMGLTNVSRYFNLVTPEMAQGMQQKAVQQAQAASQKPDPVTGIIQAETIKAKASVEGKQIDAQSKAAQSRSDKEIALIRAVMEDDMNRDKMDQDRELKSAEIENRQVDTHMIAMEQNREREAQRRQREGEFAAKQAADAQKVQQAAAAQQQQQQAAAKAQQAKQGGQGMPSQSAAPGGGQPAPQGQPRR